MNADAGVRVLPHAGQVHDAVVLGAGLAGLSSVSALLDEGFDGSVCVVEPRERSSYHRDRTWCMWDIGANPLAHLASHRWNRWIVRDEKRIVRAASDRHPYIRIPADRVYEYLLGRAESAPSVRLKLGTAVQHLESSADGVRVSTDREQIHGRIALDSRPVSWRPSTTGLLQSFVGWELRTTDPVFDPSTVILMDFRLSSPGAIEFFYVLPLGPDRALVESTVFGTDARPAVYHEARIGRYVDVLLRTRIDEVHYRERGVIPMDVEVGRGPSARHVTRIGLRGGVAKPSTGYAFLRIQENARRVARGIRQGSPPRDSLGSGRRARFLDATFLSFLRHQPERAPAAFLSLFERVPPDDLVAFLSESGSLRSDWAVVRALPPMPFVRELLRRRPLTSHTRPSDRPAEPSIPGLGTQHGAAPVIAPS